MSLIDNPYEDVARAAQALKAIVDADPDTIHQLAPVERLMAEQIRNRFQGEGHD